MRQQSTGSSTSYPLPNAFRDALERRLKNAWAAQYHRLPFAMVRCIVEISNFMWRRWPSGGTAQLSYAAIAAGVGCAPRTAMRAVAAAERCGILQVQRKFRVCGGMKLHETNRYRFVRSTTSRRGGSDTKSSAYMPLVQAPIQGACTSKAIRNVPESPPKTGTGGAALRVEDPAAIQRRHDERLAQAKRACLEDREAAWEQRERDEAAAHAEYVKKLEQRERDAAPERRARAHAEYDKRLQRFARLWLVAHGAEYGCRDDGLRALGEAWVTRVGSDLYLYQLAKRAGVRVGFPAAP